MLPFVLEGFEVCWGKIFLVDAMFVGAAWRQQQFQQQADAGQCFRADQWRCLGCFRRGALVCVVRDVVFFVVLSA